MAIRSLFAPPRLALLVGVIQLGCHAIPTATVHLSATIIFVPSCTTDQRGMLCIRPGISNPLSSLPVPTVLLEGRPILVLVEFILRSQAFVLQLLLRPYLVIHMPLRKQFARLTTIANSPFITVLPLGLEGMASVTTCAPPLVAPNVVKLPRVIL